ncbi:MAG: glycerol-3-phosphate acyltransferase [Gomphosphaeria aponina SAG 52.96 = DSM 107014]|uniref:Glycerol-3-phosphate acyltransferase n=1 Tax=Gomphosphaeria aponina SAG 52.96 = DSM 107014 TaxID=1521640 RepID=A0A941GTS2_9CHRO|nr:glycerol-3-phosphate acyltransferase [Gomphosphaeria aponina SAG 52.96 = DSM 107014]
MTSSQIWGILLILLLCPILGGLPLIDWITYAITGKSLAQLGTGNVSVSAAFYHGGKVVGILAVLSEAGKGIMSVLLARYFFPSAPAWELVALIALVIGRYWKGKGAGTTNVVWGIVVHDAIAAGLIFLISSISFTIFRQRQTGRLLVLFLLVVIIALRHQNDSPRIMAAIALSGLLAIIYRHISDDLNLPTQQAQSPTMFSFFQGNQGIMALNNELNSQKVGQKAATLSQLKRHGYSIPDGWILPPGGDPATVLKFLKPSLESPLVVRSSAIGEDSELASAAGQYITILNVVNSEQLKTAILDCFASYNNPAAVQYRQDRQQKDAAMAVLIQKQIKGLFSGVAFSRDPIEQLNDAVIIEALPGNAEQVVSGKITPQQYRVINHSNNPANPQIIPPHIEGEMLPNNLVQEVANLARELEEIYHGIPQDLEWTYDGEKLWLLQTRPITNLQPIWTRKIAAEVIPGLIRPLTWSINRPLICGVWGEIFTLVLGERAADLDFTATATLHYHRAYFNATLLGTIFRRMGLPPESLEFLTLRAKFSKPPLKSTISNIPGLLKLLRRELNLTKDFELDEKNYFVPTLQNLQQNPSELSENELLERIENILGVMKKAAYYSILAPLSLALRQGIFKVSDTELDNSKTPEVKSMRSLANLAQDTVKLLPLNQCLFSQLAETPEGKTVLEEFEKWLETYGYLSEVGTDIAVPRWKEEPQAVREMFTQFLLGKNENNRPEIAAKNSPTWQLKIVQQRLNLKGKVTEVYSQLLAHLRWSFVALENQWKNIGILSATGDIFYLEFGEIQKLIQENDEQLRNQLSELVQQRRFQLQENEQLTTVPFVIYGNFPVNAFIPTSTNLSPSQSLQGIGASPGVVTGKVKILLNLQRIGEIDRETILVVPYTDSGWAPLLARAGGLIAEVGGRLSHGAIVAREYGIPAVMDINHATQILQDGQQVKINGQTGIVEILASEHLLFS